MNTLRHVFISPHPDDVVWSCGGRLGKLVTQASEVAIVTCFDGDTRVPPEQLSSASWRCLARPSLRRCEDVEVARRIGVRHYSLGLTDAALRRRGDAWLYASPSDLFESDIGEDEHLLAKLVEGLAPILAGAEIIHAPLGGGHVDHRLVREALRQLPRKPVFYYEEFPYANCTPRGYEARYCDVDMNRWIELAGRYRSQVKGLFRDRAAFTSALRDWARQRGREAGSEFAERIWASSAAM